MKWTCLLLLLAVGCTSFSGGGEGDAFEGRGDVLYSQDCSFSMDAEGKMTIDPMPESDRPCRVVKGGQVSDNFSNILTMPFELVLKLLSVFLRI